MRVSRLLCTGARSKSQSSQVAIGSMSVCTVPCFSSKPCNPAAPNAGSNLPNKPASLTTRSLSPISLRTDITFTLPFVSGVERETQSKPHGSTAPTKTTRWARTKGESPSVSAKSHVPNECATTCGTAAEISGNSRSKCVFAALRQVPRHQYAHGIPIPMTIPIQDNEAWLRSSKSVATLVASNIRGSSTIGTGPSK
jgi:hypothetical protein